MSNIKDATTKFHFNELNEDDLNKWAKDLVLNKIKVQIWIKGEEATPQSFSPNKFEPKNKILWLELKSSALKSGPSDYVDSEIFLKAEVDKVYLFGQTNLFWDDREKSHFIKLEGKFFKSQQRVSLRVEALPELGMTIKVKMGDKEYEGFDLSFGGTSFFTEEDFEVGQTLEKIKVIAQKEEFFLPRSKVVKIIEEPENQKRVAIIFIKPPHNTEVNITKKVESMKKEIDKKKGQK